MAEQISVYKFRGRLGNNVGFKLKNVKTAKVRLLDPYASERVRTLDTYADTRARGDKFGMASNYAGAFVTIVRNFCQYSYKSYTPGLITAKLFRNYPTQPNSSGFYTFTGDYGMPEVLRDINAKSKNDWNKIFPVSCEYTYEYDSERSSYTLDATLDTTRALDLLRLSNRFNGYIIEIAMYSIDGPKARLVEGRFPYQNTAYELIWSANRLITPSNPPLLHIEQTNLRGPVTSFAVPLLVVKATPVIGRQVSGSIDVDRYLYGLSCFRMFLRTPGIN